MLSTLFMNCVHMYYVHMYYVHCSTIVSASLYSYSLVTVGHHITLPDKSLRLVSCPSSHCSSYECLFPLFHLFPFLLAFHDWEVKIILEDPLQKDRHIAANKAVPHEEKSALLPQIFTRFFPLTFF